MPPQRIVKAYINSAAIETRPFEQQVNTYINAPNQGLMTIVTANVDTKVYEPQPMVSANGAIHDDVDKTEMLVVRL